MSSPATFNGGSQIGPNNIHDPPLIDVNPFRRRHIPSFIINPTSSTPLLRISGVPFSWEHCPGIPKKMDHADNDPSINKNLLPLPPAGNTTTAAAAAATTPNYKSKKTKKETDIIPGDPFLAAIVECSRGDDDDDDDREESDHREIRYFWKGSKAVTRTLSDRFGLISMYTAASCKQRCPVSDSIIYIARPDGKHYQRRRAAH